MKTSQPFQHTSYGLRLALLLIVFVTLLAAGYAVFRRYVVGMPAYPGGEYSLFLLAIGAGVASFFSPCAFPLLPGYLALYYRDDAMKERPLVSVIRRGSAATLGVTCFNLLLGVFIGLAGTGLAASLAIGGPEPNNLVRIIRIGIGGGLMLLGVGQLRGWNLKPRFVDAFTWRTRIKREGASSDKAMFLYGFGYVAAGLGCTGPILAGLVVLALGSGGFVAAFGAYLIFALTVAGLMMGLSLLVGRSHETAIRGLKAASSRIKALSSYLLLTVGLFTFLSALLLDTFAQIFIP